MRNGGVQAAGRKGQHENEQEGLDVERHDGSPYGRSSVSAGISRWTANAAALTSDTWPRRNSQFETVCRLNPVASDTCSIVSLRAMRAARTASPNVVGFVESSDPVEFGVFVNPLSGICGVTSGEEVVKRIVVGP